MTGSDDRFTIRPAVPEDAEGVSRVNVETWLATYPNDELGITAGLLRLHLEGAAGEKTPERVARFRRGIAASSAPSASSGCFHVAAYNEHAIRFYERHGFALTGEEARDEVAVIGSVRIPEIEMLRQGTSRS